MCKDTESAGTLSRAFSEEMIVSPIKAFGADDLAQFEKLLLDYCGCVLRGADLPWGRALRRWGQAYRGGGAARMVREGRDGFVVPAASFVNASSAHGLEMDDTHDESVSHPGAVIISVALAVGMARTSSGRDVLGAIAAGYETMARIGTATGAGAMIERGFHPTMVFGTFGATTTAARLIGLTAQQLRQAWGLALSLAGGSMQFSAEPEGTTVKRLHAGFAARNGIQAAQLVTHGIAGPEAALDGLYGVCRLFGDRPDMSRLETPGPRPAIHDISFKFYPCCRLFHSTLDALAEATDDFRLPPGDITQIKVGGPALLESQHMLRRPTSEMAAQYSLPFTLATAFFHGPRNVEGFLPEAQKNAQILALADKVEVHVDPEYEQAFPAHFGSCVEVTTAEGTRHARVLDSIGTPANPAPLDELIAKYETMTAPFRGAPSAESLLSAIRTLPQAENITQVMDLMADV